MHLALKVLKYCLGVAFCPAVACLAKVVAGALPLPLLPFGRGKNTARKTVKSILMATSSQKGPSSFKKRSQEEI